MTDEKRRINLQQTKARQKRYKAEGLCTCGGIPVRGYVNCESCRKTRQARMERNRVQGRCKCGSPLMPGSKKNGKPYKSCQQCIERERERKKRLTAVHSGLTEIK